MLEWNAFIKPLVYTIELVFALVITIGTADKLLVYNTNDFTTCALGDSVPACASIISLGTISIFSTLYLLWKRLASAFLTDMDYRHDTEAILCAFLTITYMTISSVATAYSAPASNLVDTLLIERTITITFSWILTTFSILAIAIAWFAPDQDDYPSAPTKLEEIPFAIQAPIQDVQVYPVETTPEDIMFAPAMYQDNRIGTLDAFLDERDALDDALVGAGMADLGSASNDLRPRESIHDLTSAWQDIVMQDRDAEQEDIDISEMIISSARSEQASSGQTGASSGGASSAVPQSDGARLRRRGLTRRRTVRFESTDVTDDIEPRGHSG